MDADPTRPTSRARPLYWRTTGGDGYRPFSAPEAALFEATTAGGLCALVAPLLADPAPGQRILDVGCGGGRLARSLADQTGAQVIGVDAARSQVQRAHRRVGTHPGCFFGVAAAEHLPFASASFDRVVSSCTLKHCSALGAALAEALRVLRPGGLLEVVEIDADATPDEVRELVRRCSLPPGLKNAYRRFISTNVAAIAPSHREWTETLATRGVSEYSLTKPTGLPLLRIEVVSPD